MTKDRREHQPLDRREVKKHAAARPRRRLAVAGLLAGAALVGLAIASLFYNGPLKG